MYWESKRDGEMESRSEGGDKSVVEGAEGASAGEWYLGGVRIGF